MTRATDEQLWSWVDRSAPELEAHLRDHPQDASRVHRLREDMQSMRSEAPPPDPRQVGPFRLGKRLGEGGMGIVFEAEQESPKRTVAVKLLRTLGPPDPASRERFRREADALARLRHPAIAVIHSAGESESGVPYIAMELIDGLPLDAYAKQQGLDQRQRIELFLQVCDAMVHAHEQGVIHRDIKPQNVLVTADGQAKVLDFGLASIASADASLSLTAPGSMLGTLAYMSPEHISTRQGVISPASDQYSLGAMLFELLLDRLPHQTRDLSITQAALRITQQPPRRPRQFVRNFDTGLEAVLMRALENKAAQRYPSVQAFAQDLRRHLAGEPVRARRYSLRRRARMLFGRHKLITSLVMLSMLTIGLSAVSAWRAYPQLFGGVSGGGFPKITPWEAMRFRGPVPEVRLDGEWYELLKVDDTRAGLLVERLRGIEPRRWKKRLTEDTWEVLLRVGDFPGARVDLMLRKLDSGEIVTRSGVFMTTSLRSSGWAYRRELLDQVLRYESSGFYLHHSAGRVSVSSVAGLDMLLLRDEAKGRGLNLYTVLSEILTQVQHYRAGDPIAVIGTDAASGAPISITSAADSTDSNAPSIPIAVLREIHDLVQTR